MTTKDSIYLNWWLDTSRMWIIRAFGYVDDDFQTGDFGELLCHNLHVRNMDFRQIAAEWNVSLAVLGELIADHCRRLE